MPPPDDMDAYFKTGLKPLQPASPGTLETPDAKQISFLNSVLGPVRTFARNAVNTGTFGLADQAAAALRGESVEDVRKKGAEMAAENPTSATAGKFAGYVGQQAPVLRGLTAATSAARAVPLAAAAYRGLTGGTVAAGAGGGALLGGTTAGINAAADNAWGERAGKVTGGEAAKEIALGAVGGGLLGAGSNAIFGNAINRAGPRIAADVQADVRAAADPSRLAPYGLTGDAAPNLEQLLRMVPGEARDTVAPMVGKIFEKAGKGSDDALFPALRTNRAAQFPEKPNIDAYTGSFAQRADAAAKNAASATKGVAKDAPTTPIRAASFLPPEIRDVTTMLRDAAINKRAANPVIPHAQEARFLQEAAKREADPAVAARAEGLLARADPTLARQLEYGVRDAQFKNMGNILRPGPTAGPPQPPSRGPREVNLHLNIPLVSEFWNALKNPAARMAQNRAVNEARSAGTDMVTQPLQAAADMGARTTAQTAGGMTGYPTSEMLFSNLLRRIGILPEPTPDIIVTPSRP